MKWGRKKAPSPSSPRPSLISSWLFKFKKMGSTEQKPDRTKHKCRLNTPDRMSSPRCTSGRGSRIIGEDGNAYLRISFGEDGVAGRNTSRGAVQSAWHGSDKQLDEHEQSRRSNSTRAVGYEGTRNLSSIVSDTRKKREFLSNQERLLPELNASRRRESKEKLDASKIVARKDCGLITKDRGCLEKNLSVVEEESDEADLKPERVSESENDNIELGSLKTIRTNISHSRMFDSGSSVISADSCLETSEKDCFLSRQKLDIGNGVFNADVSTEWQELKQMKIAEFKAKSENQRKSVYVSRDIQRNNPKQCSKVRVSSPRTTSRIKTCKIKALQDMKKASRLKLREEGNSNLENLAIVKCSYDPAKDFRDSMMEMIVEKRMHRPEELEELLACYLTLNSDECHDLIVKVFKEVWFQLNKDRLVTG